MHFLLWWQYFTGKIIDIYDVLRADFLNALCFLENSKKNDVLLKTAWKTAQSSSICVVQNFLYRYLKQGYEDGVLYASIKLMVWVWLHCDDHQFLMSYFCLSLMTREFMALFWDKYEVRSYYHKPQQAGVECSEQQLIDEVYAKVCRKIIRDHLYGGL